MRPVVCASILLCAACAVTPGSQEVQIGDAFDLASGPDLEAVQVLRVGGLSGLTADSSGGLLAISDDRSHPRIITFRLHDQPFRLEPTGMIALRNAPSAMDSEGIALLPDGHILVSSEGIQNQEPRTPP